jgi:tetratricopeptide (TPR) repeat protein
MPRWAPNLAFTNMSGDPVLDLDPYSATSHAAMAWVYYCQDDRSAALEEVEIAITLNPNSPYGYAIKGMILSMSGFPAEAREFLATALRLDPRGPAAPSVRHDCGVGHQAESSTSRP